METENLLKNKGLETASILRMVGQIESSEISIPVKLKLLACLIPKQSVPEEAFIRMSCLLSDFEFDLNLKVEILKWMISVYSFVDNLCNFLDLIEIFLQLLDNEALQPYACHLLCKMAGKKYATKQRVDYIGEMVQKYEPRPCLVVLMFTYLKQFSGIAHEPYEDIEFDFEPLGIYPDLIKSVHPSYDTYIPTVRILNDGSSPLPPYCFSVGNPSQALSKIHPANDKDFDTQSDVQNEFLAIYKEFKSMEGPTKVEDILKNKYKRLFLTSDISKGKKTSIEDFLISMYSNLENADFLLENVEYFHFRQKSVPGMSDLTEKFIEQWDGSSTGLDVVMHLLQYEPLHTFEDIEYKLALIHEKLLDTSVFKQCDHINGLSYLYQYWVLRNYKYGHPDQKCFPSSSSVSSTVSEDPLVAIHKLGNYIALVCDAYLLDNNFHVCLQNEILLHYERVSRCHMAVNGLVLHPPTTTIFQTALFSLSSVTLENLCSLMIRYHEEVKTMKKNKHPESGLAWVYFRRFSNDILSTLNGSYEPTVVTHLSKENIIQSLKMRCENFATFFEVYRHPALIQKTDSFIESYGKGISPSSIKNVPEVRKEFFKYLKQNGQESVVEFFDWLTTAGIKRKKSR